MTGNMKIDGKKMIVFHVVLDFFFFFLMRNPFRISFVPLGNLRADNNEPLV